MHNKRKVDLYRFKSSVTENDETEQSHLFSTPLLLGVFFKREIQLLFKPFSWIHCDVSIVEHQKMEESTTSIKNNASNTMIFLFGHFRFSIHFNIFLLAF